jgi:hypothetical protein
MVWLKCITNQKEKAMLRIAGVAAVLATGLVSGAYAQTAGPTGQQDKAGMTNSNSDAMKKSGTTGMSNT